MRLLIAVSALICCASCADPLARLQAAETRRVAAEARALPELPADCRAERHGGVSLGDPLDRAAARLAADRRALNAQVRACAEWYDALRAGIDGPV